MSGSCFQYSYQLLIPLPLAKHPVRTNPGFELGKNDLMDYIFQPPPASPISTIGNGGGKEHFLGCELLFSYQISIPLPPNPGFDLGEGRDGGYSPFTTQFPQHSTHTTHP